MPSIFSSYLRLEKVSSHGWALFKKTERWRKKPVFHYFTTRGHYNDCKSLTSEKTRLTNEQPTNL